MTADERSARTELADRLSAEAYAAAGAPGGGVALLAVGGYGRGELAPFSDLDLLLVHDDDVPAGEWAGQVWYPLWDAGTELGHPLDHAVRTATEVLEQASTDLRVALGLLDLRHVAGDPNLTMRVRTAVLTQWRRDARRRLPELRETVDARAGRYGELAHQSVPDLKESGGGLRDATVLKALVASWAVDVPHGDLERGRTALLDVRDALHDVLGRRSDRVGPESWPDLADALGIDADAAQRHVRGLGRRIAHISRTTWRRVDAVPAGRAAHGRGPRMTRLAEGVVMVGAEVTLAPGARAERDPLLLLRASVEAAERGLVLAPATAARLVRVGARLPDPWPGGARDLFTRLLAAGPGLLTVWETLEETGAIDLLLPEWEQVRLLPHASVVHRFTVDRHLVETCIEASRLVSRVARPDVLLLAALLHDIGKGQLAEHSVAGAPIARAIATRMGFAADDVRLLGELVRWHLLLVGTATSRDPEDPATVAAITAVVHDSDELALLGALTEADALATATKAWSGWRAELVGRLVALADASLASERGSDGPAPDPRPAPIDLPDAVRRDPDAVHVTVEPDADGDGARVVVVAHDRVGLLADAAAMLALQRVPVRAGRAWSDHGFAASVWDVADRELDAAVLRQRLEAIVAGRAGPGRRLERGPIDPEATVAVRPEASTRATVLEVRAVDRPGLIHRVCATLAAEGITVLSAHVSTLGPRAVDVFYVQEEAAGVLSDERAAAAAHAVRRAITG